MLPIHKGLGATAKSVKPSKANFSAKFVIHETSVSFSPQTSPFTLFLTFHDPSHPRTQEDKHIPEDQKAVNLEIGVLGPL